MNADLTQYRPDWQKIERYEYCSHYDAVKENVILGKMKKWFRKDDARKAA